MALALRVLVWLAAVWIAAVLLVWSARYGVLQLFAFGGARRWWRWRRARLRGRLA